MHGGNPKKTEVYGYTGFNEDGAYASFHNPSETDAQSYSFTIDRKFGMVAKGRYKTSSPLNNSILVGKTFSYGNRIEIELKPGEVKVLEFDKAK